MSIDPIVLFGTLIVIITGAILGYLFSPKRGVPKYEAPNGALQKYAKGGRMDVKLIKKDKITHDTYKFTYELPEKDITLGLGVGHHIIIHDKIVHADAPEGEVIERKYTPTSPTTQKGTFEMVIKIYRPNEHPKFPNGGLITPKLEKMNLNETISISGPIGRFTYLGQGNCRIEEKGTKKMSYLKVKQIGMISGGTGITPMYQVIQAILNDPTDLTTCNLLFANKSVDDILIKDLLDKAAQDPRIKVYYTLDKAPAKWDGFEGFISKEMIQKTMPYPGKDRLMTLCGPPPMCNMNKKQLAELGYADSNVFKF